MTRIAALLGPVLVLLSSCKSAPEPGSKPISSAGEAAGRAGAASAAGSAKPPAPAPPEQATAPSPSSSGPVQKGAYRLPPAPRVVAIGDVHGDLTATRKVLRLAGAIDDGDRWIGGNLVVVQTGDQLDRGDDERAILDLFERLAEEAKKAGGALHVLNGNHETMNVLGDFRYVTPGGFRDFADVRPESVPQEILARVPEAATGRVAAFFPGGPYARKMAPHPVVLMVGDTVFAHGGVLPEHVRYGIDRLNAETRKWMLGEAAAPPPPVVDSDGPVWTRRYSDTDEPPDCDLLRETLKSLGARRMVVGHTPQMKGITAACDDRVFRVDVGMAAHYGGPVEALEITGATTRPLRLGSVGQ